MTSGSLRARLTWPLLAGLLVLSLLSMAATYSLARRALTHQFDATLLAKAQALGTLVQEESGGKYEFEFADEMMPAYERKTAPEFFQVWQPNGSVLERSRSLEGAELPRWQSGRDKPAYGDLVVHGVNVRAVEISFQPQLDDEVDRAVLSADMRPTVTVMVAMSRKPLDGTLAVLIAVVIAGGLLMPAGGALLVWLVLRRQLRPVRAMADDVRTLGPASLEQRITVKNLPAELEVIQKRLNELLERLEAAFQRERRFTTDVSHELRTPLAEMKTALEVAARWPADHELQQNASTEALGAVHHMEALITKLLMVVRSAADKVQLDRVPVNLAETTDAVVRAFDSFAAERGVGVSVQPNGALQVFTDQTLLVSVLRNLVENAVEHAPGASAVRIAISSDDSAALWEIRNLAPGMVGEDVVAMFRPFWRKDQSRTGDSHFGLGLTLVSSFCDVLGIDIAAELNAGELVITLRLPAAGFSPAVRAGVA